MDMMNLRMNGDNLAGLFSGGNKRKLMTACALIGNPKAILMDEPSTGMDPEAKRFMWNTIKKFKNGSSVILTTHSMDEAEALADKLAIMKDGRLVQAGTLVDLKEKYSKGFYVDLVFKITGEDIQKLSEILGINKSRMDVESIESNVSLIFDNKLHWQKLMTFGNGKIIAEQPEADSTLVVEFLLVIVHIIRLIDELKSNFPDCDIQMENIGQLLRFNICGKNGLTCGKLFNVMDSKQTELNINYQSISMVKMETILRQFIEDESYNSANDCNVLMELTSKDVKIPNHFEAGFE